MRNIQNAKLDTLIHYEQQRIIEIRNSKNRLAVAKRSGLPSRVHSNQLTRYESELESLQAGIRERLVGISESQFSLYVLDSTKTFDFAVDAISRWKTLHFDQAKPCAFESTNKGVSHV